MTLRVIGSELLVLEREVLEDHLKKKVLKLREHLSEMSDATAPLAGPALSVGTTSKREETPMENEIVEVEQNDRGFTLVELLIVIVILGILATVTVFAVRGIADKGKTAACDSDKKVLEVAIETYYANGGAGVASEALLVTEELLRAPSKTFNIDADGIGVSAEADTTADGADTGSEFLGDTEACP
jgi:general secretion pathway protein G